MNIFGGPLEYQTWHTNGWLQQKFPKFGFCTHTFWFSYSHLIWPMEQSSILSAKFDCPVACLNCSLLASAHDCETGPFHQSTGCSGTQPRIKKQKFCRCTLQIKKKCLTVPIKILRPTRHVMLKVMLYYNQHSQLKAILKAL